MANSELVLCVCEHCSLYCVWLLCAHVYVMLKAIDIQKNANSIYMHMIHPDVLNRSSPLATLGVGYTLMWWSLYVVLCNYL